VAAYADLLVAAVEATTRLVRDSHSAIARSWYRALAPWTALRPAVSVVQRTERAIAGAVYGSISALTRGANVAVSAATATRTAGSTGHRSIQHPRERGARHTTAVAVLNAAVGDVLVRRGNPLATEMALYHRGRPLVLTSSGLAGTDVSTADRLCIFVHGLGCTERVWLPGERSATPAMRAEVSFGTLLERDLGYVPIYVRYNTGVSLETNAQQLAACVAALRQALSRPDRELVLIGHSMGGLVALGAARGASVSSRAWLGAVTHVICLGAPLRGAPLERAIRGVSQVLEACDGASAMIPARLLAIRSDGVRDLGRAAAPTRSTSVHRIAGSLSDPSQPLGRLLGDGIVDLSSALAGGTGGTAVVAGVSHLRLARHPVVYEQIRRWLSASKH